MFFWRGYHKLIKKETLGREIAQKKQNILFQPQKRKNFVQKITKLWFTAGIWRDIMRTHENSGERVRISCFGKLAAFVAANL